MSYKKSLGEIFHPDVKPYIDLYFESILEVQKKENIPLTDPVKIRDVQLINLAKTMKRLNPSDARRDYLALSILEDLGYLSIESSTNNHTSSSGDDEHLSSLLNGTVKLTDEGIEYVRKINLIEE